MKGFKRPASAVSAGTVPRVCHLFCNFFFQLDYFLFFKREDVQLFNLIQFIYCFYPAKPLAVNPIVLAQLRPWQTSWELLQFSSSGKAYRGQDFCCKVWNTYNCLLLGRIWVEDSFRIVDIIFKTEEHFRRECLCHLHWFISSHQFHSQVIDVGVFLWEQHNSRFAVAEWLGIQLLQGSSYSNSEYVLKTWQYWYSRIYTGKSQAIAYYLLFDV